MAKLSKAATSRHRYAEELLRQDVLTWEERFFVIDNWQESAAHINSEAGAFFTPSEMAASFSYECSGDSRLIDMCAGIGSLALAAFAHSDGKRDITCVEINPAYVAVGRKVLPEATWICSSVEDLGDIGRFGVAVSNPPFGRNIKIRGPRYSGEADLAVIDIASELADYGCFIIPQSSTHFEYSGRQCYTNTDSAKYSKFRAQTGIELTCGSIDCAVFKDQWRGVSPRVEIALADFYNVPRAVRKLAA